MSNIESKRESRVYGYGLWKEVFKLLNKENPNLIRRNFQKYNNVKKSLADGIIKQEDLLFYLRFSNGDQRLQEELHKKGFKLYPNPEFSYFIRNRADYLSEIDSFTKYPIKRIYAPQMKVTSTLINSHFGDKPVVLKVGNLHASEGKWLIDSKRIIPNMKYKMRLLDSTIEEFIPNARSIRVGIVGSTKLEENYYITEHINSKTWLKNKSPEEENTYSYEQRHDLEIANIDSIIEETKQIAEKYQSDIIGVDWVISDDRIGLLEVNDMIGIPDGDFAISLFYREVKRICEEHQRMSKA